MMILLAAMALNPAVTPATMNATICKPGWAATVRPPRAWAYRQKLALIKTTGAKQAPGRYVADHIVPIEIGGAPHDRANLMLQTIAAGHKKDRLENTLRRGVCNGTIPLNTAQSEISSDWQASYKARIGK